MEIAPLWTKILDLKKGLSNLAPSDLQTPLPLSEFFPIGQWSLPYSNH